MDKNLYLVVTGVLFALISLMHIARIVLGLEVHVGEWTVPMFVSWIGFIVPGLLSIWAMRQTRH